MQCAAMGLPCIVSNINGCNEIIQNGYNGLIIPPKNVSLLKNEMLRIFEDKELYLILSNNARESITKNYNQKFYWNELLNEYKSLEI